MTSLPHPADTSRGRRALPGRQDDLSCWPGCCPGLPWADVVRASTLEIYCSESVCASDLVAWEDQLETRSAA